jgi:hypothetical protein
MTNLVFAITAVIIGFFGGLFIWLVDTLVEWMFSLLPVSPGVSFLELPVAQIIVAASICLIVLGTILWFIYDALKERPKADISIETMREVRKAAEDFDLLQPIIISEDGVHAFLSVYFEEEDWNESNPFYSDRVMSTSAAIGQSGSWYYIIAHYDRGRITPVSMPHDYENEVAIHILMRTKGLDYFTMFFWRGLHGIFSETDAPIPFFKTVTTGACVFFMSLVSNKLQGKLKEYVLNNVFPHIIQHQAPLIPPPKGIGFDAITCQLSATNKRIIFKTDIKKTPIDQIGDVVYALQDTFSPFEPNYTSSLIYPLQDD